MHAGDSHAWTVLFCPANLRLLVIAPVVLVIVVAGETLAPNGSALFGLNDAPGFGE